MLKVRNFPSYRGQIASIINKSKLLRLNILSADFHPFFITKKTSTLQKSEFSAFCQNIGWLIMLSYILLCSLARARVCVCVCVCVFTIRTRYVRDTQLFSRAYASLGRVPFRKREFINV